MRSSPAFVYHGSVPVPITIKVDLSDALDQYLRETFASSILAAISDGGSAFSKFESLVQQAVHSA